MIWVFSRPRRKTVHWSTGWRCKGVWGQWLWWLSLWLVLVFVWAGSICVVVPPFLCLRIGIGILVGRGWTCLGVCFGGSWVEGCLIVLCRESDGPITIDSRSGASFFFYASSFRLVGGSSDLSKVEWWANMIVWCNKSSPAALLISMGGDGKLIVVDFSLGYFGVFLFSF